MRHVSCALLAAVTVCGCGRETEVTQPSRSPTLLTTSIQYRVVKLPSLGGTLSRGMAINAGGLVAGWSNRSDGTRRAVLWRTGSITSLGTLGGPSSSVPWPGLNDQGMVVGISHTNRVDPLDEDWSCEGGGFLTQTTNLICSGFVWQNGEMRELPTFGGNHGFAAGVNNLGQIVGWAETPVHDPTCAEKQVLQFRAALWEPKVGSKARIKLTELPPLPGDAASAATAINDLGVAVGISGDCDVAVGRFSARHAVLWDRNGRPTEVPNLGGTTWHTPMDLNQAGDVVGFSNPEGPGDPQGDFIAQAFLWVHGAATAVKIGVLPGDALSEAFAINQAGQVVGVSFGGAAGARAFIYQDGALTDLNDLVETDDVLISAQDINDDGVITGRLRDAVTGETLAFVATPEVPEP